MTWRSARAGGTGVVDVHCQRHASLCDELRVGDGVIAIGLKMDTTWGEGEAPTLPASRASESLTVDRPSSGGVEGCTLAACMGMGRGGTACRVTHSDCTQTNFIECTQRCPGIQWPTRCRAKRCSGVFGCKICLQPVFKVTALSWNCFCADRADRTVALTILRSIV